MHEWCVPNGTAIFPFYGGRAATHTMRKWCAPGNHFLGLAFFLIPRRRFRRQGYNEIMVRLEGFEPPTY